ncbi:DUF1501 domain-containing protein [Tuwongella immobilis]|uniref:DUF1501 domain-containing protein n=1 Tax=Tuwongella immobilis TaxID=692036 RepID=A0A6C2YIX5_9BACT|nr:DUF1501 domain-containing protein [Tuwongella immobilis]VIP01357.1 protein containing duf1501 : Uncharacterized protein OS=Planctomyces brasiliensis (strain ATCC 49424 / DSM 5305 / JCM 21570 / NBRC 103401 / IFAM 1448) GN=Plabr_3235 PE=4 SV=1: DUF1501 [Tuwongella immobilis]VTR98164.1 protein containing duf1501 : Uncharacterized protein OS=Planctomyces brasiliensis (strain ATCC 49424 / DSM 5305 / JCM 21570 / NBRC 103401 / IFAM 1448) GN=Plabr_3235 PE=4 SV=1: DUF1501 [Tuwongella immobilis]
MTMIRRTDCEGVHRRDFLSIGTAGMLGLSLPQLLRAEALPANRTQSSSGRAKSVILVWLAGGPATIDMWDNKPEAPEGIRGEFKSIATKVAGVQLAETLPNMATVTDKISIVRSLYHTIPSHAPATNFMVTGNKPTAALQYPSMGSLTAKLLPVEKGVPPYVSFADLRGGASGGAGYLGTGYNPFQIEGAAGGKGKASTFRVRGISLPNNFSLDQLGNRDQLLQKFDSKFAQIDKQDDLVTGLDTFHQQALDILRSDKTKSAFQLEREKESLREAYGNTPFGQSALAARRLIEAGVRFATISTGGWDTHQNTFKSHKERLMPQLDQTLAALIRDLDDRGLLDSTIVMCAGEFGRTPKVNKNTGRDHWARSMACVLAGGGIKRGYVHGSTDASGMAPSTEPVTPDDIASTIFHRLGIDPALELQTPTGRPIQLFREGRIVEKLIG